MVKHLIQLALAAGQVVGRAFSAALRQEIRMSQEAAKARGNSQQNAAQSAETARLGITLDEAMQILNVEGLEPEHVEKNFEHLFAVNDKTAGGSFYLQSKVVRAKERLDQELKLASNKQGPDNPG